MMNGSILRSTLFALFTMRSCTVVANVLARKRTKPLAFVRPNSMFQRTFSTLPFNTRLRNQKILSQSAFTPAALRQRNAPVCGTRLLSTMGGNSKAPEILHINREQMEEIVEDYESGGREESQYCIIDVRTEQEVQATGKIGEHVYTLPVQVIMQSKVFDMDPEEFEEYCKFPKPTFDETIVFTCAAGMRSVSACHFAAQSGYSKLINYTGGANEWFSPSRF